MRTTYPHTCVFCLKDFSSRNPYRRFCSVTCSNRFNLNNKNKRVVLPRAYSTGLAELFGILFGDGSVTKYFAKIFLNASCEKPYAQYVQRLCQTLFPKATVTRYISKKRGTVEVQISSSDVTRYFLANGFDPKKRSVPEWIQNNKNFNLMAIRGLFDTEGTMGIKYFHAKKGKRFYKQLTFTNKNKNLLAYVETQLKNFGYRPTNNSQKNIYISNEYDIHRYSIEIGSSNRKLIKKLKMRVLNGHKYGRVLRMVRN